MVIPEIHRVVPDQLGRASAEAVAACVATVIAERGRCRFGLSGGSTPKPMYAWLATLPIEWEQVQLLWGDERCVPPDDEQSNYRMVNEVLVSQIAIPERNVFRIRGEDPPDTAVRAYSEILGDEPIDLLMLGMGSDGHTASLFPGEAELSSPERVVAAKSPVPPHDRVTITIRAINESRSVYVLVAGTDKSDRLADVEAQVATGYPQLPMAHVQPASGRLVWFVDTDAASKLKDTNS